MRILHASVAFAALSFIIHPLRAQISFGGTSIGSAYEKIGLHAAPLIELPAVDAASLMAEDEQRMANGIKGPFRFGFNHAVDLGTENSGVWNTLTDGTRIWRLAIHCPNAYSINFEFGEYVVPDGAKVFVYNTAGEQLGAFTAASASGRHIMGVTQLAGDRITVEYQEPAAVAGQGHLRITQVTHAYRNIMGAKADRGLGDSGACNNNVICPVGDDWRDQIAAVAMITVGGSGLCTGTLINNCANDGTPYFLTANHCTQGANVGTWVFRFNWESPTCTPTTNGPTNMTVSGAQLLVNSGGSDVALLQLNAAPPSTYNIYYSGWDASGDAPTNQTCVHHPQGDIKKISFDNNAATNGTFGGAQCWHILGWDDGTTEPGSSGSCLLDQNHRIIGQLFGGEATCANDVNDYFGRFGVSYPLLQSWLGTCSTAIDGYDPNGAPAGLDAQLLSVTGIDDQYCNTGTITPTINVKNVGTTVITQFTYSYDMDGGASTTNTWNGTLAQGQVQALPLSSISVGNGNHTFHASCSAPNGEADENPANDNKSKSFFVANPGEQVTVQITTDNYGSETTWEIAAQGGGTLFSGGPYVNTTGGTTEGGTFCLAEACYTFTIHDAYGDGICCGFGNGDYQITDANSNVLLNGDGSFLMSASSPFCVGSADIAESALEQGMQVYPNPGNGVFDVRVPALRGEASLIVRDALGREVRNVPVHFIGRASLDLQALPNGTYSVELRTATGHAVKQVSIAR